MMSNRLAPALLGVLLAGTAIPVLTTLPLMTPARAQSGASYTLRRVTFVGNAQVPSAELQAALPYQAGQTIDHDALQANMDAISGVYRRHNVGANISQRMTATGHAATITYTFAEQAPVAPTVTHVGITADTVTARHQAGRPGHHTFDPGGAGGDRRPLQEGQYRLHRQQRLDQRRAAAARQPPVQDRGEARQLTRHRRPPPGPVKGTPPIRC